MQKATVNSRIFLPIFIFHRRKQIHSSGMPTANRWQVTIQNEAFYCCSVFVLNIHGLGKLGRETKQQSVSQLGQSAVPCINVASIELNISCLSH